MISIPIINMISRSLPRVVTLSTAGGELGAIPTSGTGLVLQRHRLDTDPIGAFSLPLINVVPGSRVHVETAVAGTAMHDSVAAASTVVISLSAYSVGSANNDLRIKVRKGSSGTNYQPWETLATAVVGSSSIYVSQIPDE